MAARLEKVLFEGCVVCRIFRIRLRDMVSGGREKELESEGEMA